MDNSGRHRATNEGDRRPRVVHRRTLYKEQERKRKQRRCLVAVVLCVCILGAGGLALRNGLQGQSDAKNSENQTQEQAEQTTVAEANNEETRSAELDERSKDMMLDPSRNSGWRLETDGEKKVYLTFDDGPSENTDKILAILAENDVKATFFVTGHTPEKFDCIKKEWEAGHSVGMHSYSHKYSEIYTSVEAYKADLDKIANVIKDQIGFVPFLIRFPGGSSNSIADQYSAGIMTNLTSQLVSEGYQYFDWNMSSGDAESNDVSKDVILSTACQEGWTNIMLLMHDTDAKNSTVEALPEIIKYYKDRGYQFCAITRDSFAVHHAAS